jgi:glycosyltransferase involved in cell wall biosynthesis
MTISLAIIAKNSEKTLEKTLESFEPVIDEIILVDTGSSDSTKEIALKYNAKIFDYKWENDFSKAKNYALSLCSGDWILNPDADEYIDIDNLKLLKEYSNDSDLGGVTFLQYSERENKDPIIVSCLRYFRNLPDIKFKYSIHEVIETKKILDKNLKILRTDIKLHHSGYLSENLLKIKHKRNLNILKTKLFLEKLSEEEYFHYGVYYLKSNLNNTSENSQEKNIGLNLIEKRTLFFSDKNSISLFNFYSIIFDFIYKYKLFNFLNDLEKEALSLFKDAPYIYFKLIDFYKLINDYDKVNIISKLCIDLKVFNSYNPDLIIDLNRFMNIL